VEELVFGLMEVTTTFFEYVGFDGHGTSWRVVHPWFTFIADA
jgi:hypothetical protein